MPIFRPDTQVMTPAQMSRLQRARQRLLKGRTRLNALNRISPPGLIALDKDGIPGLNDDRGFISLAKDVGIGVLDILQRPNFAVAGFFDELFVKKSGIFSGLGRMAKEVYSGILGIEGEKDTFRDVLDGLDLVSERTLGEQFESLEDTPLVGRFNARGALGLALDIFLDPLTYITGGGSAFAKVPTKFASVIAGGAKRLGAVTDDATRIITRRGQKVRQVAEKDARTAILEGKDKAAERLISRERDRLAIDEVQDSITNDLIQSGVNPASAGRVGTNLAQETGKILRGGDAVKLSQYLARMNSKTAGKVKQAMGLDSAVGRQEIGLAVANRTRNARERMIRTGLEGEAALAPLAADIAYKRSVSVLLETSKNTTGLVAERGFAFSFGQMGHFKIPNLPAYIARSEVGERMLQALYRTSDMPGIAQAVTVAKFTKDKIDIIGRGLNTAWDARKLAGFHLMRRAYIDGAAGMTRKSMGQVRNSKFNRWYQGVLTANKGLGKAKEAREAILEQFAKAVDTGNFDGLNDAAVGAAVDFKRMMDEVAVADMRKGLLKGKDFRRNYFPHFVDNSARIIRKMMATRPGRTAKTKSTIGRFAEQRTFNNISEWEEAARQAGVELKMNFDPMVALESRMSASIQGHMASDFYSSVVQEFGEQAAQFSQEALERLAEPLVAMSSPAFKVAQRLADRRAKLTPELMARIEAKYGGDGAAEVLRARAAKFTNHDALFKFMANHPKLHEFLPQTVSKLAPDGTRMVQIASHMGKEFGGYFIPQSAVESISRMRVQTSRSAELDNILAGYDTFNNRLKVYLTAMFPAFHFRNAYSNISQNFLDIGIATLNPVTAFRAAFMSHLLVTKKGQLAKTIDDALLTHAGRTAWIDKAGRRVSFREGAAEMRRSGVISATEDIFEGAGKVQGRPRVGAVPPVAESRTRVLAKLTRKGTEVGGFIENEARIQLYITLRSRGLSEAESAARVQKLLFDYNALTEFERTYLKRAIPFYVWTKKNVALQASAIRNNPGRIINQQKVLLRDDEDTPPLMDYEVAGNRLILDRNGKDVRMLTGIDLPIMSIDRLMPLTKIMRGELGAAWRQVAAQMNPFLKVPQEMAANESFFDGRSLDRQTSMSIGKLLDPSLPTGKIFPQAVRNWMAYDKTTMPNGKTSYSFDGQKFYMLFRTWHVSRFLSSSDSWFNRAKQDVHWSSNTLAIMTSLKDQRIMLDEKRARVYEERLKQIEDELVKTGRAGRFQRIFPFKNSPRFTHSRGNE